MRLQDDRRYRAMVIGLLLCAVTAGTYYALAAGRADPDTFWHIATGRYIVTSGTVPTTDVFSWYGIEHRLTWTPQSWLFGVIAYAVWWLGGFRLLYMVTATAVAAIVGLVYWLSALRSRDRMMALAVAALSFVGLIPSIAPRPHVLTYLLLLVLALLLEHEKWWWAVPVVLLGVNLHGPVYPMYLLVVAYYALPKHWTVFAACLAVVGLTPTGIALLPYPFLALLGEASPIQEFARVAPADWPGYLIALLVLLLLLDRRRMPAKESLGLAALIVLSLLAGRHMAFMFVLALPLAAPYLELPSQRTVGTSADSPPASAPPGPTAASRFVAAMDGLLVIALLAGTVVLALRASTQPVDPFRDYPEQAAGYLKDHDITRYFNEWADGGFLIFEGMNPLIDGRGDQYFPYPGRATVTLGPEYVDVLQLEAECEPFLEENQITHVMIRRSSALGMVLRQSPAFRDVYHDDSYVIYEWVGAI